jgi:hypothetical protein
MTTFFGKYSTILLISLLLAFLVLAWLFPSAAARLGIIVLLASFSVASLAVMKKHRQAYLQGNIDRLVLVRNILFEIFGLLLAMALAGLLGSYIVGITTHQINNDLIRFTTGIIIGLIVGFGVGVFIKQAKDRFATIFSQEKQG